VVVFEQTSAALEQRLGFRTAEYGLRQVFKRVPDHPLLSGLDAENLHDWRGEATLLPPRLNYRIGPAYQGTTPTVEWCGMDVPRIWRCGCRGNVASVLIEKPARGDFLPILDGGYSLQYSPLMEYREGKGMVLFCQMDVTGRTESDPAAEALAANILRYASDWTPARKRRAALYVGGPAGKRHLERAGVTLGAYDGGMLSPDQVLIVGAGGGTELAPHAPAIAEFLKAGGNLLALGLDEQEANSFLPAPIRTSRQEHIAAFFEPFGADSLLAGIGPADVHDRSARRLPLVSAGAVPFGDGVLAKAQDASVVFCQLLPYEIPGAEGAAVSFQTDTREAAESAPANAVLQYGFKRTYRRASFLLTRLLADMGVAGATPLLARFGSPVLTGKPEKRWLDGLYLDQPEAWDDPYRFFCW
jgi:beta-galactosidase